MQTLCRPESDSQNANKENSMLNNLIRNNLSKNSQLNESSLSPPFTYNGQKIDDDNTQVKRQKLFEAWDSQYQTPPASQLKALTMKGSPSPPQDNKLNDKQFFELPSQIGDLYKKHRNISSLYEWQNECLSLKSLNSNNYGNVLYLAPTSGGKTLIAEEKVRAMAELSEELGFNCEEYAHVKGQIPPVKRLKKPTLYICTIEKANSLINSLIETNRLLDEIGLVMADEVHMIGDGSRGAIYEILLTKIKHMTKTNKLIQLVATTATLENKHEVADYFNACLYERNYRPVELKEYVKADKSVFRVDKQEDVNSCFKLERMINFNRYTNDQMKAADPDYLIGLVLEVIPNSSCLIFCSTKRNCENVATLLAEYLPRELTKHKREQKLELFNEIKGENAGQICSVLRKTLPFGIAYHHSGLTSEERQLIEQAYKDGVLCVITCTSTLAAGVNLPAKRVIIRSPFVGTQFLSTNQYKQMVGRAGRAGLTADNTGESILIINEKQVDRTKVNSLITGPMTTCLSSLNSNDFKSIRVLILTLIDLKLIKTGFDICEFFEQTLFSMQNPHNHLDFILTSLNYLIEQKFIICFIPNKATATTMTTTSTTTTATPDEEISTFQNGTFSSKTDLSDFEFKITKLGRAAIKSGIDLDLIQRLHGDLSIGLKHMVLSTNLHLLYLCTPYDLVNAVMSMDYDIYARKYCNLNEDEIKCATIIGVQEQHIQKKRFQKAVNTKLDENVFKRFYLTLIIYDLWKTNNCIWQVAAEFQLDRGFVQQIVQSAASFANCVLHFCENLDDFWPYKNLLAEFCRRLQYNCVSIELIPLLDLDNVRLARAKQLFTAGYTSLELIASAKPGDIAKSIQHMPFNTANKIVKSARELLKEQAELLQNQVDNILDQMKHSNSNES